LVKDSGKLFGDATSEESGMSLAVRKCVIWMGGAPRRGISAQEMPKQLELRWHVAGRPARAPVHINIVQALKFLNKVGTVAALSLARG
jgi:hypothetical protein